MLFHVLIFLKYKRTIHLYLFRYNVFIKTSIYNVLLLIFFYQNVTFDARQYIYRSMQWLVGLWYPVY